MNARLKQLRLAKGLSLEQLSSKMGGLVSKQALSKYEKGAMWPSPSVMLRLASALGVRSSAFSTPPQFEIEMLEFRKKSTLGKKASQSIQAAIQTEFERRLDLQFRLPGNPALRIPIKQYEARNEGDAEIAASKLRKALNLGLAPIGNLTAILEDHHVHVINVDAPDSFDGFSLLAKDSKGSWVSAAAAGRTGVPGDRQRLTLAHEIGHLTLKPAKGAQIEKLAFRFAAAFLVPPETFASEIGERRRSLNIDELIILKSRFGVSIQALVRRARDLGIITETSYKHTCMMFSRTGWRKKEPGLPFPREDSTWVKQTALRGWSEGLIGESEVETLLGSIPDSASSTSLLRKRAFLKLPRERRKQLLEEQTKKYDERYGSHSEWTGIETVDWE